MYLLEFIQSLKKRRSSSKSDVSLGKNLDDQQSIVSGVSQNSIKASVASSFWSSSVDLDEVQDIALGVRIKMEHKDAIVPHRADAGSAGYDLYSVESVIIPQGQTRKIATGICLEFSSEYFVKIYSRSSMALKNVNVIAGVIDSSYRGLMEVILQNTSDTEYVVNKGDRIAQMVFHRIPPAIEWEIVDVLEPSKRNDSGFGR